MDGLSGKFFVRREVAGDNEARICYRILSASQPYVFEDIRGGRFTRIVLVLRPESAFVKVAGAKAKIVTYGDFAEEAMAIETVEVGLMNLNRYVYDDSYGVGNAMDRGLEPPKRFPWDTGYQA